jgi:hypothetical protein
VIERRCLAACTEPTPARLIRVFPGFKERSKKSDASQQIYTSNQSIRSLTDLETAVILTESR